MKLQVNAPDSYLVERYLEEIARTYDIKWRSNLIEHEEEDEYDNDQDEVDSDGAGGGGGGGGGGQAEVSHPCHRTKSLT